MQTQDTGKFRTQLKDQFYTKPATARWLVDAILRILPSSAAPDIQWIEPSAGTGVFLQARPGAIGLDIDPKSPAILTQDFLTWTPPAASGQLLFFGNPPFGRQGSLAKRFLARAASFTQTRALAFILPLSFQKPSMYRCIPTDFHLVWSEPVSKDAFVVNGESYNVPCIGQIWERRAGPPRQPPAAEEPVGFSYVKAAAHTEWHLGVRRVGGKAGTSYTPAEGPLSPQSHYFLCFEPDFLPELPAIQKKMNAHVFPTNTTGPRSLSKHEVTSVLNRILEEIYSSDAAA